MGGRRLIDSVRSGAFTLTLSHRAEGSPQNNACTDGPLSLEEEGWGEGEHTALVVIPFTLCSLLLCHDMTGERAGGGSVATTPGDPGFRRKIAASRCLRLIPSGLSGTGGGNIPVKPALSPHPCASPRPTGNASAIYSRTEASLKAFSYSEATLSLLLSNYWGSLSPQGEGTVPSSPGGEGIRITVAGHFRRVCPSGTPPSDLPTAHRLRD